MRARATPSASPSPACPRECGAGGGSVCGGVDPTAGSPIMHAPCSRCASQPCTAPQAHLKCILRSTPLPCPPCSEAVQRCKSEIQAILNDDESTEELECPAGIVGRIIGRGGETIRALQSASQVPGGAGCVRMEAALPRQASQEGAAVRAPPRRCAPLWQPLPLTPPPPPTPTPDLRRTLPWTRTTQRVPPARLSCRWAGTCAWPPSWRKGRAGG